MEVRLLPINTLLTLLTRGDMNPAILADAGFRVAGLEVPAVGRNGKAVIDVLLVHESTNHLVACESKSGANVEERQAKAYAGLTATNVVQAASLSLKATGAPTLEFMYLCLGRHADRIRLGLTTLGLQFPVLVVSDGRVELHNADYASPLLASPLAGGVNLQAPVARIIPFDADSPVTEIQTRVFAQLAVQLVRRVTQISLTSLTEQAIGHYSLYALKAQNSLKLAVAGAVRTIAAAEPDRFAFDPPTGTRPEAVIRLLKTPEDLDPRGRTQAYQALGRPRRTARRAPTNPDQLDLLAELERDDDDDYIDNESVEDAEEGSQA